jgi:NADP-dependent 3-hydroxy acid dehydrogenase YdfG
MKKNITITGTTRGLGKALADRLMVNNNVRFLNRPNFDLEKIPTLTDVCFDSTDVLILNAGHQRGGKGFFQDHALQDWQSIIDCNVVGNLFLIQKYLQQNNAGTIVIITSAVINKPVDDCLVYTASRHALHGAIYNLRFELTKQNKKIRLLEIVPSSMRENVELSNLGKKVSSYQQVADAICSAIDNSAVDCVTF